MVDGTKRAGRVSRAGRRKNFRALIEALEKRALLSVSYQIAEPSCVVLAMGVVGLMGKRWRRRA